MEGHERWRRQQRRHQRKKALEGGGSGRHLGRVSAGGAGRQGRREAGSRTGGCALVERSSDGGQWLCLARGEGGHAGRWLRASSAPRTDTIASHGRCPPTANAPVALLLSLAAHLPTAVSEVRLGHRHPRSGRHGPPWSAACPRCRPLETLLPATASATSHGAPAAGGLDSAPAADPATEKQQPAVSSSGLLPRPILPQPEDACPLGMAAYSELPLRGQACVSAQGPWQGGALEPAVGSRCWRAPAGSAGLWRATATSAGGGLGRQGRMRGRHWRAAGGIRQEASFSAASDGAAGRTRAGQGSRWRWPAGGA